MIGSQERYVTMNDLAPNIPSLQAFAPTSNRGSILVIDDSPAITDMICCVLELAGYQAMACAGFCVVESIIHEIA